jgi:hypothetical protein
MDGIFLLALIGFAALSAGLLGLCARLRSGAPVPGADHGGPHGQGVLSKHGADDRGLS